MSKQALLIFYKNPEAGKVKTRLAATMGNEKALLVYLQLVAHTISVTKDLAIDKFVFYADYIEEKDNWNDECYYKRLQQGNGLGERMKHAFAISFENGYDEVVIIGTDCFELNETIVLNAFHYLKFNDVVIGPAKDGGYYLLGMKKFHKSLFEKIEWSTGIVLGQTIKKCVSLQLGYCLLPVLSDVDEENDLASLKS